MRRWLPILAGLIVLLGLAGGGAVWFLTNTEAPGPLAVARAVVVPRGTPATVAESLRATGVIESGLALQAAAATTSGQGPLRAGEFAFPAHVSLSGVLAILRNGRAVQHRLTIPEGLTAAQIAPLLDRAPTLEGDTILPHEGGMLPETYAYTAGTTRAAMVERAEAAMTHVLAQAWADRSPNLPLASPTELLTLASIVERETARPEERAHVAGVFLNRLRHGMRLQSDPTTAYATSGGMTTFDRGLTRADLDNPHPYNTYAIPGLPPGPIVSPGQAAIEATARPLPSDDLYFVADGHGGHAFAATLEDHNRNVARWRALAR